MYTSYSLVIRAVERISFLQNFDFNCTKSMPQLKVSFNHNHSLKLPDNNAKSFRETKHLSTTQTGTLLQSSEINTIKEKVRSLGKSDQASGNKKTDLFSLHVLFSHFTSCDATLKNSFFQMSSLSTCKCTHNL